jgi:hypothetical protein
MMRRTLLLGLLLLTLPTLAHAEVMDKEPAVSVVWGWAIFGGVLGASAWSVRWWLGLPISAVVGLRLAGVWSEIADPHVGVAILAEAGEGYLWSIAGANVTAAALHVLGAIVGCRRQTHARALPPSSGLQQPRFPLSRLQPAAASTSSVPLAPSSAGQEALDVNPAANAKEAS